MSDPLDYYIGLICAIPIEYTAVRLILDEEHEAPNDLPRHDSNNYTLGRIGKHNVVVAVLPHGQYGLTSAAIVGRDMVHSFPNVKIGLMVGIGGGAPGTVDIRLGDVAVSSPMDQYSGVIQYDFGKTIQNREFKLIGCLDLPPKVLLTAVSHLQTDIDIGRLQLDQKIDQILSRVPAKKFHRPAVDQLYKSDVIHDEELYQETYDEEKCIKRPKRDEEDCPLVHYGLIASADNLMKDAKLRDEISKKHGIICFEMEAAGLMKSLPCLVIRGICDYSDSHKNKTWQGYAALAAAVYAKELLNLVKPQAIPLVKENVQPEVENFSLPFTLPGAPSVVTFTGRSNELHGIESALPRGDARKVAVICGLGGMGKTSLAVEYANRHRNNYSSILWLNAVDEFTLKNSFLEVLKRLRSEYPTLFKAAIPTDPERGFEMINQWLGKTNNKNWLMIFDNFDFPHVPNIVDGLYDVRKYFPSTSHGHIIITTRSSYVRFGKQIHLHKIVNNEDCLLILEAAAADRPDLRKEKNIESLLRKLDGLPLALSAAGAYLGQSPDSIEDYLHLYENSWLKLQRNTPGLPEHEGRTLATTWQISVDRIRSKNPLAWQLLELWIGFANQDVWYELLLAANDTSPQWLRDITDEKFKVASHMDVLYNYGLVEIQREPSGYSIHSCLHHWLRAIIPSEKRLELRDIAIACVAQCVPTTHRLQDWSLEQRLLAHAEEQIKHIQEQTQHNFNTEHIKNIATLYVKSHKVQGAEKIYLRLLKTQEQTLGRTHSATLRTVYDLAWLYYQLGMDQKISEAEPYAERALQGRKEILGSEDPDTICSFDMVASIYEETGKLSEAEGLRLHIDKIESERSGYKSENGIIYLQNFACLRQLQCRYDEAKAMYMQCHELGKELLHPDDELMMKCFIDLGKICDLRKEFTESLSWYHKALRRQQQVLGEDHRDTLGTVNEIGMLYIDQMRYDEAEKLLSRTLEICKKGLSTNDEIVLIVEDSLGIVHLKKGNFEKAEELLKNSLEGSDTILGCDHLDTVDTVENLGHVYLKQGKHAEADAYFRRAHTTLTKHYGSDHERTKAALRNIEEVSEQQKT